MIENPFKLEAAEDVRTLIRGARERRGMSAQRLAQRADVSQSMVTLVETGGRLPSTPMLIHLLDALGYDLQAVRR